MQTTAPCAHILFNPFHKVSNAGMFFFQLQWKTLPTTVMCFHLIPLGLLSQLKCLKIGSIFDFTKFKIQWIRWNFGELNIHTHHSPNWMQFSVRETKLSHNFSHLGIHGLTPPPQRSRQSNVSQCRSGRFQYLYVCDKRTLISRNTPTESFFLQKPKVANGFESGS
jgi:hypothetical protein